MPLLGKTKRLSNGFFNFDYTMIDRYTGDKCHCHNVCDNEILGNGIYVKLNIQSASGMSISKVLFALRFYIYHGCGEIRIRKEQLKVMNGEYYALLNDKYFTPGLLLCDVEILEPANGWPDNLRPVTIKCNTGISIGGCVDDFDSPCDCAYHNGKGFENGYCISFEKTNILPEDNGGSTDVSNLKFKVENGHLYVSYDNGVSWEDIGIVSSGDSGILPDNEDITSVTDGKASVLKFKNRDTSKGKGYVILRTNKALAEQMTQENTIYEVRYDFDLGGETLEVSANCVLDFRGGSFSNGKLIGNNTLIKGYDNVVFGRNLAIEGTYTNDSAKTGWFEFAEGCVDSCQVISKHVEISDSRNYGVANLQDGCVLDVNGQDAVFSTINTYGEYVYIDLAGGSIGSTFGGGLVAETVTGGNTFIAQDGHSFYVGQRLHSSKDVGAKTVQFFGSANYPLEDPVLITAVDGNTITMNKDLGEFTLHKGLGLGNTSWDRFIETYGKKVVIANGVIKNIYSYVCTTWSDGLVEFNHVDFKNLGLDSFHLSHYATLSFFKCNISKPIDYAKTTIMLFQGNVLVDSCNVTGGNFDHFIGCWQGDYEGDDTVEKGIIRVINSSFDGTKYDEDAAVQNNLHCINIMKHGTFNEITIDNCTFKGYARHILSSTVLQTSYDLKIENINISKVHLDGIPFVMFWTNTFSFDSFVVRDCSFANTGSTMYFIYLSPLSENYVKYINCSFNNIGRLSDNILLRDNSIFENCKLSNMSIYRMIRTHIYRNCEFNNVNHYYGNTSQTSTFVSFNDEYSDCRFYNCSNPFYVSAYMVKDIFVTRCTFINCTTIVYLAKGTNTNVFYLVDSIIKGCTKVISTIGYIIFLKMHNVSSGDYNGFTEEQFDVTGGGNYYKFTNIEGLEDIIYPAPAATASEDETESTE